MKGHEIVALALGVRTLEAANSVNDAIANSVGARYERPIGDRWNNQGLLTASGASFDHKILEGVTNMQDAVIELYARRSGVAEHEFATSPGRAATALLGQLSSAQQASLVNVIIDRDAPGSSSGTVNVTMRDHGCGMTARQIPRTIFQLGAGHKDGRDWLQGTFGLGGATMYRNAEAVVLVTRRHPELLAQGEPDEISVAVVTWSQERTTTNASYLVTSPWAPEASGELSSPFTVPASEYPSFAPGTSLTLIGYATSGLGRKSGDERSFDTVFNTRLFHPVMPISYQNLDVRERVETLRGLAVRLDNNAPSPEYEGTDTMPFKHEGVVYNLPMRFRLFEKPGTRGERRKFVAHGHVLAITSNGQVHAHWTADQFHRRTRLNKLKDRIFVLVDTDALPIGVRAQLFTADRSDTAKVAVAIRLEEAIGAFLDDWPALADANAALVRESIQSGTGERATLDAARKIARALKVKGIGVAASGRSGGSRAIPRPTPPEELLEDPTHLEGPAELTALRGTTRGVYLKLNAENGFIGAANRGSLTIAVDHPDMSPRDFVFGELSSGRIRVSITVPETEALGSYSLVFTVPQWLQRKGGVAGPLEWRTELHVVDELPEKAPGTGAPGGKSGSKGKSSDGDLVAVLWTNDESGRSVGEITQMSGAELADLSSDYEELRHVQQQLPTIQLNVNFAPYKRYIHERSKSVSDAAVEASRERYLVGVGVGLMTLREETSRLEKAGVDVPQSQVEAAQIAAASAVLAVLPDYDVLARNLGE